MNTIKKVKLIVILLVVLVLPVIAFSIADNYFSDRTNMYIEKRVQTFSTIVLNEAINEGVLNNIEMSEIMTINYKQETSVSTVILNTKMINQIINDTIKIVDNIVNNHLDKHFPPLEIPLGTLISKAILANKGPDVVIPIIPIVAYSTDVLTNTTEYGINNCLFEVYIYIKMEIEALVPLQKQTIMTENKIILVSELLQGEVPRYYYSSGGVPSFPYIPNDSN